MVEHLGRHFADHFSFKIGFPDEPVSSAEINSGLGEAIVHWQTEPVALDAQFVTECFVKSFPYCDGSILDRMVFIDV